MLLKCAASNGLRYLMRQEQVEDFQPSRLWLYWYTRMDVVPMEENTAPPDPHEDSGVTVHSVCATVESYHCCPEPLWPYDDSTNGRFCRQPDGEVRYSLKITLPELARSLRDDRMQPAADMKWFTWCLGSLCLH